MAGKNEGERPAFPHTHTFEGRGLEQNRGMTLRDYFAANSGFTVQLHVFTGADGSMEMLDPTSLSEEAQQRIADFKASMSWRIADAMLAGRDR